MRASSAGLAMWLASAARFERQSANIAVFAAFVSGASSGTPSPASACQHRALSAATPKRHTCPDKSHTLISVTRFLITIRQAAVHVSHWADYPRMSI